MIVDTEKVSREADGPEDVLGWKGDRPWVRLKERTGEEPDDHKRECLDGLQGLPQRNLQ